MIEQCLAKATVRQLVRYVQLITCQRGSEWAMSQATTSESLRIEFEFDAAAGGPSAGGYAAWLHFDSHEGTFHTRTRSQLHAPMLPAALCPT